MQQLQPAKKTKHFLMEDNHQRRHRTSFLEAIEKMHAQQNTTKINIKQVLTEKEKNHELRASSRRRETTAVTNTSLERQKQ